MHPITHHTRHTIKVMFLMFRVFTRERTLVFIGIVFFSLVCETHQQKCSVNFLNTVMCPVAAYVLIRLRGFMSRRAYKCLFFKDDLRRRNIVHLCHFSQYGVRICYSALREQPSWRLWDKPVGHHLTENQTCCGSECCS